MKHIGMICIIAGITIMAGAAGASDAGTYTLWQSVGWLMTGFLVAQVGAAIVKYDWR